jgi:hypothetical protein
MPAPTTTQRRSSISLFLREAGDWVLVGPADLYRVRSAGT